MKLFWSLFQLCLVSFCFLFPAFHQGAEAAASEVAASEREAAELAAARQAAERQAAELAAAREAAGAAEDRPLQINYEQIGGYGGRQETGRVQVSYDQLSQYAAPKGGSSSRPRPNRAAEAGQSNWKKLKNYLGFGGGGGSRE